MSLGPFDLSGGPFLFLYGVLFGLCFFISLRLEGALRPMGRTPLRLSPQEAALLTDGAPRFAEAVVTELLATGRLQLQGKRNFLLSAGGADTDVVRALQALPAPLRWPAMERALTVVAQGERDRLVQMDLLLDRAAALRVRIWLALPFVTLAGFGLVKLLIGEARGRPVGFLTAALIVTIVIAVVRAAAFDGRSQAARTALEQARVQHSRLRRAAPADEAAMGVALFGTAILIGSGWEPLHRLRTTSGDATTGSDGGTDGGSDGGDGGGGGCGGCSS